MSNILRLREDVKKLPLKSGVYKMYNDRGEIIYVGKAKILRNRVKSYFDNSPKNLKTHLMAESVDHFEYIVTPSEQDAFSLENNLIKENQPKYNILLKDDKAFPYIKIDRSERYPYPVIVRRVKNDGALYFGPYVTGINVGTIMEIIKTVFNVRTCAHNFNKNPYLKRACVLGEIGVCTAPCINKISEEDYNKVIDDVIDFLNGKTQNVKNILKEKMNYFADSSNFEEAIKYRDELRTLERSEQKVITSLTKNSSFDFFVVYTEDEFQCITHGSVRNGKMVAERSEMVSFISGDEDILNNYIAQYYNINVIPNEIIINSVDTESISNYLSEMFGKKIQVLYPRIGVKKTIIDMAVANSKEFILKNRDYEVRQEMLTTGALNELQKVLKLDKSIYRIEGFDISNIQGTNNVSSMVVFEGGKPAKKEYRKFKIKSFEGANDFEAMKETLYRRFTDKSNSFKNLPDLILIDGGLGQLHFAHSVIEELGLSLPIISLAKKEEEIYTIFSSDPILLSRSSYALRLLQRVRDESHRFAIGFHRSLREKGISFSLEKIDGVGKKRAGDITAKFASSEELMNASLKEIEAVPNISKVTAKKSL